MDYVPCVCVDNNVINTILTMPGGSFSLRGHAKRRMSVSRSEYPLSELSVFYHQYYPFRECIVSRGIILFFQAGTEQGGKCLVETCLERSHERLYQFVSGGVGLPVNEFD